MIVCVCNRLNEATCRETAGSGRCRTVGCMYRLHGHRIRCGKCLPLMSELLANHAPEATPGASVGGERSIIAPAAPER
jgi:bacterioferritin-associated ferredoxin